MSAYQEDRTSALSDKSPAFRATIWVALVLGSGLMGCVSGTPPRRPAATPNNAVFLWGPSNSIQLRKSGWWVACRVVAARNRCSVWGVGGYRDYEGEYLPYRGRGAVPADQLLIDAKKSQLNFVSISNAVVPIVFLRNGDILIPAEKYEQGLRLLGPDVPAQQPSPKARQ